METINIAGVNCRVDRLNKLSYEQIYESAIGSMVWKGKQNAADLIDKELRDHGFKPSKKDTIETEGNQPEQGRGVAKKRNSSKRKRNS